jgi:hypothetical protein
MSGMGGPTGTSVAIANEPGSGASPASPVAAPSPGLAGTGFRLPVVGWNLFRRDAASLPAAPATSAMGASR